jgi:aspartyl-tRNA(Asn)/glutamyl-tRNA(Gln) amidotransferase subunit A
MQWMNHVCLVALQAAQLLQYKQVFVWFLWEVIQVVRFVSQQTFCGIVGLKPTYGRISRYGLIAYASSFDQIGIFANNVDDASKVLEIIAGADEYDSTVSQKPVEKYSAALKENKKFRFAYFKETLEHPSLDTEIADGINKLIEQIKSEGHEVTALSFEYLDYIVPAYYILTTAEASSNLSRYDGVRYGYRSAKAIN